MSFKEYLEERISNEQINEGGQEKEYEFYGKLVSPNQLKDAADYEDQEQYHVHIPCQDKDKEISIRVRKTTKFTDGEKHDPVFTMTLKAFHKEGGTRTEVENKLDEHEGKLLLKLFRDENNGLIKRRYFYKVKPGNYKGLENSVWEVDVFKGRNKKDNWVKLDLEVKSWNIKPKEDFFPIPFPISLDKVIYNQKGDRNKEETKVISKVLNNV